MMSIVSEPLIRPANGQHSHQAPASLFYIHLTRADPCVSTETIHGPGPITLAEITFPESTGRSKQNGHRARSSPLEILYQLPRQSLSCIWRHVRALRSEALRGRHHRLGNHAPFTVEGESDDGGLGSWGARLSFLPPLPLFFYFLFSFQYRLAFTRIMYTTRGGDGRGIHESLFLMRIVNTFIPNRKKEEFCAPAMRCLLDTQSIWLMTFGLLRLTMKIQTALMPGGGWPSNVIVEQTLALSCNVEQNLLPRYGRTLSNVSMKCYINSASNTYVKFRCWSDN